MSCIKFIIFALLVITPLIQSYHFMDVQNDVDTYEVEGDNSDKVLIATEELEPNKQDNLMDKIEDLEASNNKMKQELIKARGQLIRKVKDGERKKVADVQIQSKIPNHKPHYVEEKFDVWSYLCGIAKHIVGGVLGLFGIRL